MDVLFVGEEFSLYKLVRKEQKFTYHKHERGDKHYAPNIEHDAMVHSEEAGLEGGEGVVSVDSPCSVNVVTVFNLLVSYEFFMELGGYSRVADQINQYSVVKESHNEAPNSSS